MGGGGRGGGGGGGGGGRGEGGGQRREVNASTCKGEVCADECLAGSCMSHLHITPTD